MQDYGHDQNQMGSNTGCVCVAPMRGYAAMHLHSLERTSSVSRFESEDSRIAGEANNAVATWATEALANSGYRLEDSIRGVSSSPTSLRKLSWILIP